MVDCCLFQWAPKWFESVVNPVHGPGFNEVVPPLPDDYEEVQSWEITAHSADPDGWLYTSNSNKNSWFEEEMKNSNLRRRLWTRVSRKKNR